MVATTFLPVSRLVNFGLVITPQTAQGQSLSTGLVLGTSTVIDTVQRMRTYLTLASVAVDFGTSSEEYLSAVRWFGQSPQPTALNIGRWCKLAAAGKLICAPLSAANQLLTAWTAINNGSLKIAVDGVGPTNVPAMNFTGAVTLQGIAAIIQTAMQGIGGGFATATCVYNSTYTRFEFTSGTTGTSSTMSFLTAGTGGTDISGQLGGLVNSGGYVAPGVAAETALNAVILFDTQYPGQWYNLSIPSAVDSDWVSICPYIDADNIPHFCWITTQEVQVLAPGDTTHLGFLLQQLQIQHAYWQYSSTDLYAAWSAAAKMATINWAGSNTAINLMYKTEPGVFPESLTASQASAIDGYNGNVYVNYQFGSGTPIIEQGICPSGQFVDTIIGADALRIQMQANVFNILLSQPKVPQTDAGVNTIVTGVSAACAQFITNGFGAPGVWTGNPFGQLANGQWLDKGYYNYAQPIALQATSQRNARVCPPIQTAFKCAGAIDTVQGTLYINQ